MPSFSQFSLDNLATCDPDVQRVFHEVIKHWDCRVLEGHRSEDDQNGAFLSGTTQVKWPDSNHNTTPSLGVDVVPYPIDWEDWKRFYAFAGFVIGVAAAMRVKLVSGLDWNDNRNFKDQRFFDAPHFHKVEQ